MLTTAEAEKNVFSGQWALALMHHSQTHSSGIATIDLVEYHSKVMFSIQKLLGRDQKIHDLLEASAQQADTSVHQLIELLRKLEQHELRGT